MLLAVEGGRFFSSSALGYSNGLNVLLLGHKKDEKPMRVTPWNQYHLVDQELDPDIQLAATKNNRCGCGCASFVCFGRAAAGPDSPSVGPTRHQNQPGTPLDLEKVEENNRTSHDDSNMHRKNVTSLKSSLKRRATTVPSSVVIQDVEPVHQDGRRSVHWTDVTGGELFEIREFEPSEHSGSDDEFENDGGKTCSCRIM